MYIQTNKYVSQKEERKHGMQEIVEQLQEYDEVTTDSCSAHLKGTLGQSAMRMMKKQDHHKDVGSHVLPLISF